MGLKKRLLMAVSLMILIAIPIVYAQEVRILLKDPDGNMFANKDILYELSNSSGQASTDNSGAIVLPISSIYRIIYDGPHTPGYDLYAKTTLSNNDMILTMKPIGSLRVMVVDAKNKPISNALVRIDCNNNYGEQGYFYSDDFGIVNAKFLPEAGCTIKSAVKSFIITQNIDIKEGDNKEIILMFNDYAQPGNNILAPIIVLIIFIIMILSVILYFIKGSKNKSVKPKEEKEEVRGSGKEDIITALDRKEKEVMRFLIKELSDKESISQSKIVYGLGMAKTSLTRILMNLEAKNLINIEKIGKLKKISLTEWFKKK